MPPVPISFVASALNFGNCKTVISWRFVQYAKYTAMRYGRCDWFVGTRLPDHSTHAPARFSAASTSPFPHAVLMNNSCRAPWLSAIAFQPFCVGTVTRT